jgi:hypothetical protein
MLNCKRNLNPFQLRHLRQIGGMLGSSVAVSAGFPAISSARDFSETAHLIINLFAILPIVGTLFVIARYLAGERDEYLRSLVVRAVLWGFGVVMVCDTLTGALIEYHPNHLPFGLLNMDLFVVTGMISLRLQLSGNQPSGDQLSGDDLSESR